MKKKASKVQVPEIEAVKLRPLFGMQPGKYLTILYAFLLLLLLFALLIYPGLRNYGTQLTLMSSPSGSAVYIDDTYRGSTPLELFIPAGTHTIRVEHVHFTESVREIEVGGRVVATLLFPREETAEFELEPENGSAFLAERFQRASDWAMIGSFHDRYRYPSIVADTVAALFSGDARGAETESGAAESTGGADLSAFLYYMTNNMSSPEQTADVLAGIGYLFKHRALAELHAGSYPARSISEPSGKELAAAVDFFRQLDIKSELLPLYLYLSADEEEVPQLSQALRIEETLAALQEQVRSLPFDERSPKAAGEEGGGSVSVEGHSFLPFSPSARVAVGNPDFSFDIEDLSYEGLASFPHRERVEEFYLAAEETTQAQYARFLEEKPRWRRSNLEALLDEEVVTKEYMRYPKEGGEIPVTNISWYAARAYCRWLTQQLPADIRERYRAALPGEVQWEYAARLNGRPRSVGREQRGSAPLPALFSRAGARGLLDMTGNVWEWTSGWYFPADLLDGSYGLAAYPSKTAYRGVERAVRGGSWANEMRSSLVWERGSHPPAWCTPFTGFRVALIPIE